MYTVGRRCLLPWSPAWNFTGRWRVCVTAASSPSKQHQVTQQNTILPYFYNEPYSVLEMSLIIFQALYMCGRNLGTARQRIRNEFSDLVTVSWRHIFEAWHCLAVFEASWCGLFARGEFPTTNLVCRFIWPRSNDGFATATFVSILFVKKPLSL